MLPFHQVDVFSDTLGLGNPVAVVHAADDLDDATMAAFARWTNLSETTFLLRPSDPAADYRVRIFTPGRELPFAGHPTLGTARAWLEAGGAPRSADTLVQECGVGLVRVRRDGERLAFAAPDRARSGPVDPAEVAAVVAALGMEASDVVGAHWCDNGPGWMGLLLRDADLVLDVDGARAHLLGASGAHDKVGLAGLYADGSDVQLEVRAFFPGGVGEDPVTGSLNAALAQWLVADGVLPEHYVAAQGTSLGRRGRVHVDIVDDTVWVGGHTVVGVTGTVTLGHLSD
ncbi:PhzF family phenazine biosynthesis protein [Aeromicrobium erythreum]|uniref:Phenazine biosynthesis protein PhzF n=1 Tax=Aeromicrobium erythreum TaxID=2041 RepID=A0A0U4B138_9ACTN|nr:PhzF family phenazine biosynthesis protein [Aeromicrobium erythreum]ALX06240.1 phenazine biosynthesis protein PhzF [Aeromicrobium erythreum]